MNLKIQFSQMHWGRVLLIGVLVVLLVIIINLVLPVLANHVWSQPDQAHTAIEFSSWSIYILLLLLTFGGALWAARSVEIEPLLHGILIGLFVGVVICILTMGFGSPVLMALVTLVLIMAAGCIGGLFGSIGR